MQTDYTEDELRSLNEMLARFGNPNGHPQTTYPDAGTPGYQVSTADYTIPAAPYNTGMADHPTPTNLDISGAAAMDPFELDLDDPSRLHVGYGPAERDLASSPSHGTELPSYDPEPLKSPNKESKTDAGWARRIRDHFEGKNDKDERLRVEGRLAYIKNKDVDLGEEQLRFFAQNPSLAQRCIPPGSPNYDKLTTYQKTKTVIRKRDGRARQPRKTEARRSKDDWLRLLKEWGENTLDPTLHTKVRRHLYAISAREIKADQKVLAVMEGFDNLRKFLPRESTPSGSASVQQAAWQTAPGARPAGPSSSAPPAGDFQHPGAPSTSHGRGRH
ncbi:hypothetical protein [Micromonospora sp. SH-82]|uniref:hypothetical protein n=1 Tax=Micromonospora sp. SH-82 TaxID=3132938 RepID=UPI003EC09D5F